MSGRLRLTLDRNSDGTARLIVEARDDRYSGLSSATFDLTTIARFAEALNEFPVPPEGTWKLQGGFWGPGTGELGQPHVVMWARPLDRRGAVGLRIFLATPIWPRDDPEVQSRVALTVRTDYRALQSLSRELARLVAGDADEAVLDTGPDWIDDDD